ncbi:MAG: hypothetical protein Q8O67_33985 [Deltaproteobacteria bacterium]|nr:hypothetical protein [Deltaproteobacteria bacterium]
MQRGRRRLWLHRARNAGIDERPERDGARKLYRFRRIRRRHSRDGRPFAVPAQTREVHDANGSRRRYRPVPNGHHRPRLALLQRDGRSATRHLSPMQGFRDEELVVSGDGHRLYRHPLVFGVELFGPLDDVRSDGWRTAVTNELERCGRPRFFSLDASDSQPISALSTRVRSAAFARAEAQRFELACLYTGPGGKTSFTVKAVLRMAGMANVVVVKDAGRFAAAVIELRAGRAPRDLMA